MDSGAACVFILFTLSWGTTVNVVCWSSAALRWGRDTELNTGAYRNLPMTSLFLTSAAGLQSTATLEPPRCHARYGFSAVPGQCDSYLLCVDYRILVRVKCPAGQLFDVVQRTCRNQQLVNCTLTTFDNGQISTTSLVSTSKTSPVSTSKTSLLLTTPSAIGGTLPPSWTTSNKPDTTTRMTTRTNTTRSLTAQTTTPAVSSTATPTPAVSYTATPTPATRSTATPTPTISSSTTPTPPISTSQSHVMSGCDVKNGYSPDPAHCGRFLVCSSGSVRLVVRCPPFTQFHSGTRVCRRSDQVLCGSRPRD